MKPVHPALASSRARWFASGVGVLSLLCVSCTVARDAESTVRFDLREDPRSTRPGARTIVHASWTSVLRIGGSDSDTSVYYPAFLQADSDGVFVYDLAAYRVVRISREGEVEWTRGRQGEGPDEFKGVRDIELDAAGRLWILDPANARITVLDRKGTTVARIALRDLPYTDQVMPSSSQEAVLLTLESSRPLVRVDSAGNARASAAVPWSSYPHLHPLASQMTAATDAHSELFVLAFRAGNGFFAFRADVPLEYFGIFVEHIDFPAVTEFESGRTRTSRLPSPIFSAYSVALWQGRLFVLFSGRTEYHNRVVDVYHVESGEYLRSFLLPRPVSAISLAAGVLYAIYEDPYPVLEAWRPEDSSILK